MKSLRTIDIKGGDFELIRLAEDHFCMFMNENLSEFYKKRELEKLEYAKDLIREWQKMPESEMEMITSFLTYSGFEYEIK